MQKIAEQIATRVFNKLAYDTRVLDHLANNPELQPPKTPPNNGVLPAAVSGGLSGATMGTLGAAFNPRLAKAIPNDKLRLLAGILGGGAVGAGLGGGGMALANRFLIPQPEPKMAD